MNQLVAASYIMIEDDLSSMSEAERAAFRAEWIGFVFQSFQLLEFNGN